MDRRKRIRKAIQNGYSPIDVAKMQAIARTEAKKMEQEATEIAFVDMLAVPCSVLAFDYWPKSAKKKMPEFIKEVVSLYESIQVGAVTREEIIEEFEKNSGIKLEAEWYRAKEEANNERNKF